MAFVPVVVTPTYNNAGTLMDVLGRVDAQGVPAVVVDDGSTDATAALLAEWARRPRAHLVRVITHRRNRGKAAALRTGFAAAAEAGYTHAVTLDTDGQLDPEQIPDLLAVARERPAAIVVGTRDTTADGYPARSLLGRRVSNLLVWMESGLRVADSQCGMRVYPLDFVRSVGRTAGRYGFETEILTRAGWAGRPVVEAPVRCHYLPRDRRVSHFRPWRDSIRGFLMHVRLVMIALWPWTGRANRAGRAATAGASTLTAEQAAALRPLKSLRGVARWLSPVAMWRQLRQEPVSGPERTAFAGGVGIGAFIANLPCYGFHLLISLYVARRLRLNPLSVVLGSQLSTPPVGPALGFVAVALGHLLLHGSLPRWEDFAVATAGWQTMFRFAATFLLEWFLGSVVVGVVCLFAMFFVADWALRLVPPAQKAQTAREAAGSAAERAAGEGEPARAA